LGVRQVFGEKGGERGRKGEKVCVMKKEKRDLEEKVYNLFDVRGKDQLS
jgi:hypothetical protein